MANSLRQHYYLHTSVSRSTSNCQVTDDVSVVRLYSSVMWWSLFWSCYQFSLWHVRTLSMMMISPGSRLRPWRTREAGWRPASSSSTSRGTRTHGQGSGRTSSSWSTLFCPTLRTQTSISSSSQMSGLEMVNYLSICLAPSWPQGVVISVRNYTDKLSR